MKLKKFAAISLTVAMSASVLAGCGNEEKSSGSTNKKSAKEVSASSFADVVSKSSEMKNYEYETDIDFSIKADELKELLSDDDVAEIMDVLGITGSEIKANLSFDGKVKGDDAQTLEIGFELGKLSGTLTEVVFVDDVVYVNVADAVDLVTDIADKFGMADDVAALTSLIPEGDYIAIPTDVIEDAMDAVSEAAYGMSIAEIAEMAAGEIMAADKDAAKKMTDASEYCLKEIEKIAKKADKAYSEKNGYTITVSKDNLYSVIKAAIEVFAEDSNDIIKNLETLMGDSFDSLGVSSSDIDDAVADIKDLTDDDWKELEETITDEMEDFDFSVSMSADYSGEEGKAVASVSYDIVFAIEGVEIKMGMSSKIKENADVKVKAPESVMSDEDVKAILSSAGIESVDDFADLISGSGYGYDYDDYDFDYDYDDYDYDYDDYDFDFDDYDFDYNY